jgi:hypothetical protein
MNIYFLRSFNTQLIETSSVTMSRAVNTLLFRAAPALRFSLQQARSPCLRRGFAQETSFPKPLKLKGVLEPLKQFKVTPTVGTEFPEANLVDMLNAPNSDELLRDLAITSKRFRGSHSDDRTNGCAPYSFSTRCRIFPESE